MVRVLIQPGCKKQIQQVLVQLADRPIKPHLPLKINPREANDELQVRLKKVCNGTYDL